MSSRILIAVATAYEALTVIRPNHDARTRDEANFELAQAAGSHLDPDIVRGWIRMTDQRQCF